MKTKCASAHWRLALPSIPFGSRVTLFLSGNKGKEEKKMKKRRRRKEGQHRRGRG